MGKTALLLVLGMSGRPSLPPPVAPFGMAPLPRQKVVVPMIFPLLQKIDWRDSFGENRGGYRHTGIDLAAPKMTPIVAPFAGRIGFKEFSFWIYGDNGWRVLGTHLNDDFPGTNDGSKNFDFMFAPNLRFGDRVIAGQLIGYVGDSGMATGPHLHFELHGPNGIRNPKYSLKMAQRIRTPRFPLQNPKRVPSPGQERWEVCLRAINPDAERIQAIILMRQFPNGRRSVDTYPNFASIRVGQDAMPPGVTWLDLLDYPKDNVVSVYLRRTEVGLIATRLVID